MARAWFLDPLDPLRAAFELGFHAGQSLPPHAPVAVALTHHADALAALAPRAADPRPPAPDAGPPDAAHSAPIAASTTAAYRPDAPTRTTTAPSPVEPTAFASQLAVARQHHPDLDPDLRAWPVLPPLRARRVMAQPHAGVAAPTTLFRLEPRARWVALCARGPDDTVTPLRLVSVARDLRASLLGDPPDEVDPVPPPTRPDPTPVAPPPGALPDVLVRRHPAADPDAPLAAITGAPPTAVPVRVIRRPGPDADAPAPANPDPDNPDPPAATPPNVRLVDASTLRICAIEARARHDLRAAGVPPPSIGSLAWARVVPPHEVAALARRLGWALPPDRAWGARRIGADVFLIGAQQPPSATVSRFARLPPGGG
jgi:hypothetical protein